MTEAEQVMKRCQIGTRNYNEANNLHADCYRVIGKLLAEHAMREVQRLGQEIEQAPVAKYSDIVSDGGLDPRNTTPPQRTEQCNYPDCKCPTENPCLKGLVQPEQEPKIGCVNHDCDQCKAQPEQVIQSYSGKHNLEQEPVAWMDKYGEIYKDVPEVLSTDKPLYTSPPQRTEQNFCPRCGKRTKDIHTCTPPKETT
jgi:hypothetical protein